MKKISKSKKILLLLLPIAAVVATPVVLTSCGAKQTYSVGAYQFDATTKYNGTWPGDSQQKNTGQAATLEVLDPNINGDAQNKANFSFKNGLSKQKLQQDFDRVLSKFYKAYEYESEGNKNDRFIKSNDVEAEILKITVDSFNKDNLTANLKVQYKVEGLKNESRDYGLDKDEQIMEEEKPDIPIKPYFATFAEIDNIKAMLTNLNNKDDDQEGDNFSIDVEDLLELYVGDKEDNEKSIFEQVEHITKDSSKYGGLLGYSINVQDLAWTPKTGYKLKTTDLTKQNLFAPSSVIQEFYVPQVDEVITKHKLDFTISYEKVSKYTLTELKSINSLNGNQSSVAKANPNGLNDILKNEIKDEEISGLTIGVQVHEITSTQKTSTTNSQIPEDQIGNLAVLITIKENDTSDMSRIVLTIDKNWAKSETTPSVINNYL